MKLKQVAKYILGYIRCRINHISAEGGVYIGRHVNIQGGKNCFLGGNVSIRPGAEIWCSGEKIVIGAGTEIGERDRISIANELIVGEKVLFSPNVYVTDCDHAYADIYVPIMDQGIVHKENRVVIKENCYIGINSVIVGNVTIGKHCIIGANSVVTKDIPDYSVAAGIPARVLKQYSFQTGKWEKVPRGNDENINACQLENRIL